MKVSVCGCGWLGLPLAKKLAAKGYEVYGSRRDPAGARSLKVDGIQGIALDLPFAGEDACRRPFRAFFHTDILVINVPPGREEHADKRFIDKIQSLSGAAKKYGCRRILFISTTSVYGSAEGEVNEGTLPLPDTASARAHLFLEQWLKEQWRENVVVLRLAGLIGPGRHPVKYLSGRKGMANGNHPVNLIHLDDCIQAIEQIIACWPSQTVLHLSAPSHPSRKSYYAAMASAAGLSLPEFAPSVDGSGKTVNAQRSCELLGLILKHPDLMVLPPELP